MSRRWHTAWLRLNGIIRPPMEHRHLNHRDYTLAAIDDIIDRGRAGDWVELHLAAASDEGVRPRIAELCRRHLQDPRAQRYQFWRARLQFCLRGLPLTVAASVQPERLAIDVGARFQELLTQADSAPPPGCLDGIDTSVRQLVRTTLFEATPTLAEILQLEAVLVLKRNACGDYADFVKVAEYLGAEHAWRALERFDALYPQPSGESALLQLEVQLASPVPHDHCTPEIATCWEQVRNACASIAQMLFEKVTVPQHVRATGS